MKPIKLIIATLISVFCLACNQTKEETPQFSTINYASTPEDSISNKFIYNINISYPTTYKNNTVLESIQQDIIRTITGDSSFYRPVVNESIENFISDQKTQWKESLNEISKITGNKNIPFSAQLNINAESPYADPSILSYASTVYSYYGGAHGTTVVTYRTYDLRNGKALSESDIFEAESNDFISNCMLKKLEENCKKSNSDIQQYYLDKIVPNGNFYLNAKGITYIFNQYDIAPYAYGQTEIFIPYKEFEAIIKEDCPITKYIR